MGDDSLFQHSSTTGPSSAISMSTAPQGSGAIGQPAAGAPRLSARELFRHGREVLIDHNGQVYRLRLTRQNRLILNK